MGLAGSRNRHKTAVDWQSSNDDLSGPSQPPPEWTSAPETSVSSPCLTVLLSGTYIYPRQYQHGLYNEATDEDYVEGQKFFDYGRNQREPPRLLPSDVVDCVNSLGCKAWGLEIPTFHYPYTSHRFAGLIQNLSNEKGGSGLIVVNTYAQCEDVCLLSDLPILAGLYDIQGKSGVYFEVLIEKMNGVIAIGNSEFLLLPGSSSDISPRGSGTACRPYPAFRLPGWHRDSAGFHLDDLRKFFEDSEGGQDYQSLGISSVKSRDTVGFGYEFSSGSLDRKSVV